MNEVPMNFIEKQRFEEVGGQWIGEKVSVRRVCKFNSKIKKKGN